MLHLHRGGFRRAVSQILQSRKHGEYGTGARRTNYTCVPLEVTAMKDKATRTKAGRLKLESRFPVSELDVPMLPKNVRWQLFGNEPKKPKNARMVAAATRHLQGHDLLKQRMPEATGEEEKVALVEKLSQIPLEGSDIEKHYETIGSAVASPYWDWALELMNATLPPKPPIWRVQSGWTRYTVDDPQGVPVVAPLEAVTVFDVETLIDEHGTYHFPTMAVAASTDAWYSWCSQRLVGVPDAPANELILFAVSEAAGGPVSGKRLIVGHNVSFDRSKIAEEYHLQGTNTRFLDTLSMHMCYNGMSSGQRQVWHGMQKTPDSRKNIWTRETSTNGLGEVYKLYMEKPLDKSARDVFTTGTLDEVQRDVQSLLTYCACDVQATFDVYSVIARNWLPTIGTVTFAGMLEMGSTYLPVSDNWYGFVGMADQQMKKRMDEVNENLIKLAYLLLEKYPDFAENPPTDDEHVKHLDWSLPKGTLRRKTLQHRPQWFRDLCKTPGSAEPVITTRTRVAAYLLRLLWNGKPLMFHPTKRSWGYTDAKGDFHKLPHAKGDGSNVGNPMAKNFLADIESGVLTSEYPEAKEALRKATECSYWISAQSRVKKQMVYRDPTTGTNVIIPMLLSAGTVTRRAVEATWLTASNTKNDRVGSELKAQVIAPEGYQLVGADVDSQELWIAAVIGDAHFCGLHGCTAMGWMALRGQKSDGTDVHSRTAALVGIDRNTAKIFNYGRIYGAGQKFAKQLLLQNNRTMTDEEADRKAQSLYLNTKGTRLLKISPEIARKIKFQRPDLEIYGDWVPLSTLKSYFTRFRKFEHEALAAEWRFGTESHMFNALEGIAKADNPKTPVLGVDMSKVLSTSSVGREYLRSRVNWVVQSSAVDYLHLMLVTMKYLCHAYKIDARFIISIHDEVRYICKEEDSDRMALALQTTNLWVRAMFSKRLGFDDLPLGVAFFEAVDLDRVLRKEVDMDCLTPSNDVAIAHGRTMDIYDSVRCTNGSLLPTGEPRPPTLTPEWLTTSVKHGYGKTSRQPTS